MMLLKSLAPDKYRGGERMGWKRFNDRLAVILAAVIIPGLWIANTWLQMTGEIIGASIVAWTLVVQYYFRKKEG